LSLPQSSSQANLPKITGILPAKRPKSSILTISTYTKLTTFPSRIFLKNFAYLTAFSNNFFELNRLDCSFWGFNNE